MLTNWQASVQCEHAAREREGVCLPFWQACVQCEHAAREQVCLAFGRRVCTANVLRVAKYSTM